MSIFRKKEQRATEVEFEDGLLKALLGTSSITKEQALNIPSVRSCINFVADTVATLPIKLYKEDGGKAVEIKGDKRIKLLNDDTGDTLDAVQFWRAMLTDYYLGKGGYAYIKKDKNNFVSLHYTDEIYVAVQKNSDPIFKCYDFLINGQAYKSYDFIKLLRNTKDGASGIGMTSENKLILSVAYNSLVYEEGLVLKGGNKRGFLKASKRLTQEIIDQIKKSWANLYSNNSENVVVLNDGIEFQEASSTSVEMQLNENKVANSAEICKIFNISASIISGSASAKEYSNSFKMAVMPVLNAIQCALNKDFLLEREKGSFYFAFDTKEMLKGDVAERYKSYSEAVKAGWISKNEIRFIEDMPAIDGFDVVSMSLGDVIYDINSKTYFTPNTSKTQDMDGASSNNDNIAINADGEDTIAKVSLNGAQVQSLLEIVTAVVSKQLEYSAAVTLITSAFPFNEVIAKQILGNPNLLKAPDLTDGNLKGGETNESGNQI